MLRQFERNLGRITDERRIARLEADLEELERAVETARQAWLLARTQTQQTSEITNDIRERINFTKQVMAVWDTASGDDQRTVVDWWVDSILVKPGRKEGKRQKGRGNRPRRGPQVKPGEAEGRPDRSGGRAPCRYPHAHVP